MLETLAINFKFLGENHFKNCNLELLKIASSPYIPEGFCYGAQIKEVILPDNIAYILSYAFSNGRIGKINIPKSCKTVYRNALASVEELVIEDGEEQIKLGERVAIDPYNTHTKYEIYYAFNNSIGLRKLYIGRPCEYGDLYNYDHLTEVTISSVVTDIEEWKFAKSNVLEKVVSYPITPPNGFHYDTPNPNAVLYCPTARNYISWFPYFSKIVSMGADIEEIENVETMETITTSTPIYDLQGRMVRPNSDTAGLPKGIYIVGGKKRIEK